MTSKISTKPGLMRRAKEWRYQIGILLIGILVIHAALIPLAFRETGTLSPVGAAQFGDFVGGYIGTIFVLISVVFLYSTLSAQRKSDQTDHFQSRYFQLLELHNRNVSELELQGRTGRGVFVVIFRELREAIKLIRSHARNCQLNLTDRELLEIAYHIVFFGVGPDSGRMLSNSLPGTNQDFLFSVAGILDSEDAKSQAKARLKINYVPFEGHQSRLGHYFRHLFQMVKFIDRQEIDIDKYDYARTVRAQLSTHEQAILLANSLAPIGRAWWNLDLIVRYKLVQNIPFQFFDPKTELNPESFFDPGYFEYEELMPRSTQPPTHFG